MKLKNCFYLNWNVLLLIYASGIRDCNSMFGTAPSDR